MCGKRIFRKHGFNPSYSQQWGDTLYREYIQPYWNGKLTRFYDTGTDFYNNAEYDFTQYHFLNELNQGYGFVNVITHGSQTGWEMEDETITPDDFADSVNNPRFSVITSAACQTNAFDTWSSDYLNQDPCLSERLIRNPNSGVIAFWGHARNTTFSTTIKLSTILEWIAQFYYTIFTNDPRDNHYGKIVNAVKTNFVPKCQRNTYDRDYQFGVNAIGDTEMPIFSSVPQVIDEVFFFQDENNLTVTLDADTSCDICIRATDEQESDYFYHVTDVDAHEFNDVPNQFTIAVTCPNHIPRVYFAQKTANGTFAINECHSWTELNMQIKSAAAHAAKIIGFIADNSENKLYIKTSLNETCQRASLNISPVVGTHSKSFPVEQLESQTIIPIHDLQKGIYVVSLIVDGNVVDNAKFIK